MASPLQRRLRPHGRLNQTMHEHGKQRGHRTEARDRIGRHRFEPARQHRIGRPDKGRDKGRDQAGNCPAEKPRIAGEQQHRAGKSQHRADDVMHREPLARQQRREQHDQQRPEIIQKPRFGRRGETQRQEIQRVIAEQSADADDPGDRRLAQRRGGIGAADPGQRAGRGTDRKCHGRKLKGRNLAGRDRHDRQQRPHQDRGQSDQGRGAGVRRHCERSEAIQPSQIKYWIASSLSLLAMTKQSSHHVLAAIDGAWSSR